RIHVVVHDHRQGQASRELRGQSLAAEIRDVMRLAELTGAGIDDGGDADPHTGDLEPVPPGARPRGPDGPADGAPGAGRPAVVGGRMLVEEDSALPGDGADGGGSAADVDTQGDRGHSCPKWQSVMPRAWAAARAAGLPRPTSSVSRWRP